MGLKISYTDTETNEVLRETTLDDDEMKAFSFIAYDAMDWIDNCFQNRARVAINEVCKEALGNNPDVILKDTDRKSIGTRVGIFGNVKEIPVDVKKEIIRKSVFESAKKRTDKPIT